MLTALLFGLRMLVRDPGRLLRASAGLSVAVVIVLVEISFWTSVSDAHLRIIEASRADLFMIDWRRLHLNKWDKLAPMNLSRARATDGVAEVQPIYQAGMMLRTSPEAGPKRVIALGIPTDSVTLDVGVDRAVLRRLAEPGTLVYDRGSRSAIYGDIGVGDEVLVDDQRMKVVGTALLGPNLVNDGNVLLSLGNMQRLRPGSDPIMALVRVRPDADLMDVRQRLAQTLGSEVQVYTRAQLQWRETRYLGQVAPAGVLFGAGMIAGLLVGAVICYQSFYMTVRRQGKAFATLSAMGAPPGAIGLMVLVQALVLSVLAFLIAWGAAEAVAWWLRVTLAVPASLKPQVLWPAAAAVLLVCALSAWLALRHAAFRHAEQLY